MLTFYILIMAFNLIIFNFELHNYEYDKYQKTDNKTDGPGGGLLIWIWLVCLFWWDIALPLSFLSSLYCFYELLELFWRWKPLKPVDYLFLWMLLFEFWKVQHVSIMNVCIISKDQGRFDSSVH